MKNKIVLLIFFILILILTYSIFLYFQPNSVVSDYSNMQVCKENQTQYCSSGSCPGISTCHNGIWSSCKWDKVCTPGAKAMCIEDGCAYAIKICNECGTGFGPCGPP